ncbi:MAG: threonylcarbamoyl-AMP synthase [Opitutaceae bacterium]|nr:threonylcarbamoyl-AMP synthase [Verrucomicrobiales bacterium]
MLRKTSHARRRLENKLTQTEVLTTDTPALFRAAVRRAAKLLRAGEVVALPTETVYGLAANALDVRAVERIYAIKGRPAHNPIIVHIADLAMARRFSANWPEMADKLAVAFWPGPLTLVVARSSEIPDIVSAGGPTVGLRWPSHPFMQAVIRECGLPLAAPSANLSNQVSPTNAGHVLKTLRGRIPLIIDGGQAQVGIESTVVDVSVSPPRLLRPGMIHRESLEAVVGLLADTPKDPGILRSPGQLTKHYSPRAKLIVLTWSDEAGLKSRLADLGVPMNRAHVISHTQVPLGGGFHGVSVIPHDAEAFARALYGELHECDKAGAGWIVVERWPDGPEWQAIGDRLNRASAS